MMRNLGWNLVLGAVLGGSNLWAEGAARPEPAIATPVVTAARTRGNPSAVLPDSAAEVVRCLGTNAPLSAGVVSNSLPPLPPGVAELKFNEFFRQPIGPRGLELTETLKRLDGQKVRMLGFMARQAQPIDHAFLFVPMPLTLNEIEYGHADDLPATTIHVYTGTEAPAQTPYTPGLLLLTGRLSVGSRAEPDGRNSMVRLFLDPPTAEQKQAAERAAQKQAADSHDHAGHGHAH